MITDNTVHIIPYSAANKTAIKTLNEEWLSRYFKIEAADARVLSDPETHIINQGGKIFYAQYNNQIIGTVSLIKEQTNTYELSKMAVTATAQGLGIGKKLLEHTLSIATEMKLDKLILFSNRKLVPALELYKKYGFVEVPLGSTVYERADIKMEKVIDYK